MPGSPPTRIALAGTRPPPSTLSNSSIPEQVRGGGVSLADKSVSVIGVPRFAPKDFDAGPAESGASSTMVFHSPHASQRPDHFENEAPQAEQVKVLSFAINCSCPKGGGPSNLYSAAFLGRSTTFGLASTTSSWPSSGRISRRSSRRRFSWLTATLSSRSTSCAQCLSSWQTRLAPP